MVRDLFGGNGTLAVRSMTEYELALALSHRKALRRVAEEPVRWVAVFEDDATLHPSLTPSRASALLRHFLRLGRTPAHAEPAVPFVYLGACSPTCPSGTPAFGCYAYCTHAFAVERGWARHFFEDVYCTEDAPGECGTHCRNSKCQTDQQFVRYFRAAKANASIAGMWLVSPDHRLHRGLFYQPRAKSDASLPTAPRPGGGPGARAHERGTTLGATYTFASALS